MNYVNALKPNVACVQHFAGTVEAA